MRKRKNGSWTYETLIARVVAIMIFIVMRFMAIIGKIAEFVREIKSKRWYRKSHKCRALHVAPVDCGG